MRRQHQIRLSDAELAAFEAAAAKDGRKWSEWLREVGRREAGMGTKKSFRIWLADGEDEMGIVDASDAEEALEVYARDMGYDSYETYRPEGSELEVVEVTERDPRGIGRFRHWPAPA